MTEIIYHRYQKMDKKLITHSYLIDIVDEIEVQQVKEYRGKVSDSVLLTPPHPRTRFFELVITEYRDSSSCLIDDLHIYPVRAEQKPDLKVFGVVVKKGTWEITDRIYRKAAMTEIQWIYTDDFHLFAIIHGTEHPDAIVDQIVTKIDDIALSIKSGQRISTHRENQRLRREAVESLVAGCNGLTINTTAVLRHPQFPPVAKEEDCNRKKMQDQVLHDPAALGEPHDTFGSSDPILARIGILEKTDINEQIARIEELQNLDWLSV
jgi:hypothetical protein